MYGPTLESARPADLERFAALRRYWASLAELRNEVSKPGILVGPQER